MKQITGVPFGGTKIEKKGHKFEKTERGTF